MGLQGKQIPKKYFKKEIQKMKKIIMLLATVILATVALTFSASALQSDRPYTESDTVKIIDNVVYALNEDGKSYYVEDYFATQKAAEEATEIKLVSEIDGIPVKKIYIWKSDDLNIDGPRMESLPNVKKITVPEGIEEICVGAFSSLDGVKAVSLPSTVKKIWYCAFYKADSLEKVNIPSKVTVIERGMFQGCEKLKSVKIEGKLKAIESDAFYGCKALGKISLPKTVATIGGGAFAKTGLTSVTLPAGLKKLGDEDEGGAFSGCKKLTKVVFKDNSGKQLNIQMYTFSGCTALKKVYLPKSVKKIIIGAFAFKNCTKLTNVYNRANITEIKTGAFYKCKSLKSFVISKNVTKIGDDAFYGCEKLKKVTFENTKKAPDIGEKAFGKTAKGIKFLAENKKTAKLLKAELKASGIKTPNVYYVTYTKL